MNQNLTWRGFYTSYLTRNPTLLLTLIVLLKLSSTFVIHLTFPGLLLVFFIWWLQCQLVNEYRDSCQKRGHAMIAIAYKQPWSWVFVVLVFNPITVVKVVRDFIKVYGIRIVTTQPIGQPRATIQHSHSVGSEIFLKPADDALDAYKNLRTHYNTARMSELDLKKICDKIARTESELQTAAQQLRDGQRELGGLKAVAKEVEMLIETAQNEETDLVRLERELFELRSIPGVVWTGIEHGHLAFRIEARFWHEGTEYHLGDWGLTYITLSNGPELVTRILVNPQKDTKSDPPYIDTDAKSFCFGSRREQIVTHLRRGQIFEGLSLALNSMTAAPGKRDTHKIPTHLMTVAEVEARERRNKEGSDSSDSRLQPTD